MGVAGAEAEAGGEKWEYVDAVVMKSIGESRMLLNNKTESETETEMDKMRTIIVEYFNNLHWGANTTAMTTLSTLYDTITSSLCTKILETKVDLSTTVAAAVKAVASQYRMTNRPAPTQPSGFVRKMFERCGEGGGGGGGGGPPGGGGGGDTANFFRF